MHQLFSQVLDQRDLSRAGDLFSLEDAEIEDCLSQALDKIKAISCSLEYLNNDNNQAVVEICITRITTAIRETGSIEKHSNALVGLWESCLEHNLTPQGESTDDTPHAKIASDITSCILQNYSCPSVMVLAVPVAVRFLHRGNRELSRNMSSYLSLAAIAKADLLAEHTEAITLSVLRGNHMLLRVLPSIYPRQPNAMHRHLGNLTVMMPQLESTDQKHLIRLLQLVAEQHPLMLTPQVPALVTYLSDHSVTEALLGVLVDLSQACPSLLVRFLPVLRVVGQQHLPLLGHVAKIHGAVGILSETHAHSSLVYLVSLLGSMEHSFHHTVLLEVRALADHYPNLLGGCNKDIYRMSNSFTAVARLLGRRLEERATRVEEEESPLSPYTSLPLALRGSEQQLQLKVQSLEEKIWQKTGEEVEDKDSPVPAEQFSLSQTMREEQQEMRYSRPNSAAVHTVLSCSREGGKEVELSLDNIFSDRFSNQHSEHPEAPPTEANLTGDTFMTVTAPLDRVIKEAEKGHDRADDGGEEWREEADRLFIHLRDNMDKIREFCKDMVQQIPIPEQCVIEESNRGCVAKLSFCCPLKGQYCLYAKSCFYLTSRRPHLWIHLMLLQLQSRSSVPLHSRSECVHKLACLWERTQLKGTHSFIMAMTQHTTPHRKELDILQTQLEEVRFFDLFGYSEEAGGWLCFMCNNPEKATVVNQEGQPLIEGKLKEKVRWKFIKRWKTRYFTLAGNQLLFRRGKSKEELDDIPIELSKVQSVKVVAKKRRDRGLPRAFEIFTDSKTYVLKAQDEKHAKEWLQCINVAVAQARERENREATTYL
ncbi:ventricular zone-expressed PH domain-containing protein [Thalassophryne amazonica]|uniref:ventricular zone-expressed PH domain-containing protein n=1 Tax=Thalassophryne amazonica TaxID=390379 RepID=UPI0014723852|nr:ventricular zone-expressed PH domain-containing protein [Thalassophryne amazonica]XP_034024001.1 ventricular zone-expressed PH domain-containing protein [Thalassophryne amazonica]XP_034024002.1 ventricular zone-expressed PH domain-containing protein [Thalassophryne amazonica]